jgi:hypothetical protein
MPSFLKGNYDLSQDPEDVRGDDNASEKTLTDRFEESALARLGGSICFVRKEKTLLWTGDENEKSG